MAAKAKQEFEDRQNKIEAIRRMLEKPVLDAFQEYDPSHEGYIGLGELRMLLTQEFCIPITKREIEPIYRKIDADNDGKLGWNEILNWLAIEIVNGTFRGKVRSIRRKNLHVQKRYRKAKRRYRDIKRSYRERFRKREKKRYVPYFDNVLQLHRLDDFQRKKQVFYRFIRVEFSMDWILEDVHDIALENQMRVFAEVFVPRWNSGDLGYEYYYDGVTFEHKFNVFEQKWDEGLKKYVFINMATSQTHLIDPRKEEVLFAQAKEAFEEVDVDGSGSVDVNELYTLLNQSLCEPISMQQVVEIMTSIDIDGNGIISFDEFYTWYGSEYSQQQVKSLKHDGLKLALRTRRNARRIAAKGYNQSMRRGKSIIKNVKARMEQRRLEKACENADPETVQLLMEGFEKHLIQKALILNRNDVAKARDWLAQKSEEMEYEAAQKREKLQRRRQEQMQVLRQAHISTKTGMKKLLSTIKVLLFGEKPNNEAEVDYILKNLRMEIEGARQIVKEEQDNY
ncbi:hypothetical protein AeNC1_003544 [Aphanomyces euteiches]|nr:hypothetical protein AeNC1_003544 [Aphanomyces euteiches]